MTANKPTPGVPESVSNGTNEAADSNSACDDGGPLDASLSRRRFLGATAATVAVGGSSDAVAADPVDEGQRAPDLSNDYPNRRRLKGGTGYAITGLYTPERWGRSTRGETEDFGGVTELEFYQHALQWGMGISLKIRKGDVETSVSLDVDRAELLGRWLLEAARDTKRWRAENPEAWTYEMETMENVAERIEKPAVSEEELGSDRLKSPSELAAAISRRARDS